MEKHIISLVTIFGTNEENDALYDSVHLTGITVDPSEGEKLVVTWLGPGKVAWQVEKDPAPRPQPVVPVVCPKCMAANRAADDYLCAECRREQNRSHLWRKITSWFRS